MFRNRGSLPHIEFNNGKDDNSKSNGFHVPDYRYYWNGRYYVIHYDAKFILIQTVIYAIFLITAILAYIYKYNALIDDPIMQVKNAVLRIQLVQVLATMGIGALLVFFSKDRKKLIGTLNVLAFISIFMSITIVGMKFYIDKQYTDKTFEQFYEQYEEGKEKYVENSRVVMDKDTGLKIIDSKESYIRDSKTAYMQFTIKQILYTTINIFISIGILYLSNRISRMEEKKDRLEKDDIVLNDEEENVKY